MNEDHLTLTIATEFTTTPGARYSSEGDYSGEEFRDKYLEPRFLEAQKSSKKLHVILDGVEGYATSFLEEAFGGLARKYGADEVNSILEFVSIEEEYLVKDIHEFIESTRTK